MGVVRYLEKKSQNNPKDIAKQKTDERRQQQRALEEKQSAKTKRKGTVHASV